MLKLKLKPRSNKNQETVMTDSRSEYDDIDPDLVFEDEEIPPTSPRDVPPRPSTPPPFAAEQATAKDHRAARAEAETARDTAFSINKIMVAISQARADGRGDIAKVFEDLLDEEDTEAALSAYQEIPEETRNHYTPDGITGTSRSYETVSNFRNPLGEPMQVREHHAMPPITEDSEGEKEETEETEETKGSKDNG
jgi:hypothetical protein